MGMSGQFHSSRKLPPRKQSLCSFRKRLRRPWIQFSHYGTGIYFSFLGGIDPRFLGRPARSLVIIPTSLSRLLHGVSGNHSAAPDTGLRTRRCEVTYLTTESFHNRKKHGCLTHVYGYIRRRVDTGKDRLALWYTTLGQIYRHRIYQNAAAHMSRRRSPCLTDSKTSVHFHPFNRTSGLNFLYRESDAVCVSLIFSR